MFYCNQIELTKNMRHLDLKAYHCRRAYISLRVSILDSHTTCQNSLRIEVRPFRKSSVCTFVSQLLLEGFVYWRSISQHAVKISYSCWYPMKSLCSSSCQKYGITHLVLVSNKEVRISKVTKVFIRELLVKALWGNLKKPLAVITIRWHWKGERRNDSFCWKYQRERKTHLKDVSKDQKSMKISEYTVSLNFLMFYSNTFF